MKINAYTLGAPQAQRFMAMYGLSPKEVLELIPRVREGTGNQMVLFFAHGVVFVPMEDGTTYIAPWMHLAILANKLPKGFPELTPTEYKKRPGYWLGQLIRARRNALN